jgi:hypothetical protein
MLWACPDLARLTEGSWCDDEIELRWEMLYVLEKCPPFMLTDRYSLAI